MEFGNDARKGWEGEDQGKVLEVFFGVFFSRAFGRCLIGSNIVVEFWIDISKWMPIRLVTLNATTTTVAVFAFSAQFSHILCAEI